MRPRRRDFIGATILAVVLFALVAVIGGANIPAV